MGKLEVVNNGRREDGKKEKGRESYAIW